jgi:hypothetical protein
VRWEDRQRASQPARWPETGFAGDGMKIAGHEAGFAGFVRYPRAKPVMAAPRSRPLIDPGFTTVFRGGRPAEGQEGSPQGYLLARRS